MHCHGTPPESSHADGLQVLVWNDLAGGDGDYCAILVAFNSMLQMVLYAPLAIFFINVLRPSQSASKNVTVSYSVVARSVAVFLGTLSSSAISNKYRYSPRRRRGYSFYSFETSWTKTLSTTIHRLDCAPVAHRV